jgi:hypothetical protein
MAAPKRRKPILAGTGSLENVIAVRASDEREDSEILRTRQAARLRKRFALSSAVASATADIAFASGRPA